MTGTLLGQQLSEALRRAQERAQPTGKTTPEGTALKMLREEFSDILSQAPPTEGKSNGGGNAQIGKYTRQISLQTTPYTYWLMDAKVGECFIIPNAVNPGSYAASAERYEKTVKAEVVHLLRGTAKNPTLMPCLYIEVIDPNAPKSVPDAGPSTESAAEPGIVKGGVQTNGGDVSPRQRRGP